MRRKNANCKESILQINSVSICSQMKRKEIFTRPDYTGWPGCLWLAFVAVFPVIHLLNIPIPAARTGGVACRILGVLFH